MNNLLRVALFPLTLVATVVGAAHALARGVEPALVPAVVTVVALALVLVAERALPRVARAPEADERRTDLAFVGLTTALDAAFRAGLAAAVVGLAAWLPAGLMASLPMGLGAVGVLLVAGMGDYWAHRFSHEQAWWWRLHAVHHAPHRMVALNNFRLHPIDLLLKIAFATLPVLLLGFAPAAVALAGAIKGLSIAFQHADVDLRHGPLNFVFATNSVHRWHHSARAEEAHSNYGGVLSVFDLAFGTWRVPAEDEEPAAMGLFDERHYPIHAVTRSTVAPLCWRRCVEHPPQAR